MQLTWKPVWIKGALFVSCLIIAAPTFSESGTNFRAAWAQNILNLNVPGNIKVALTLEIPHSGRFRLRIVGPDGRNVRTMLRDQNWEPGKHEMSWDGKDDTGRFVPGEAYTPFLEEWEGEQWVGRFSPNADNHGAKVEIQAAQWDAAQEKLLFYLPSPARVRVFVVSGNDGLILANLRDMEPVDKGMIAITWNGLDPVTGERVAEWGKTAYHYTACSLPACFLIVSGPVRETYMEARPQYSLAPECAPKAYADSSVLHRLEYAEQKEIRFHVTIQGNQLTLKMDPISWKAIGAGIPEAKIFFKDKTWVPVSLKVQKNAQGSFMGRILKHLPKPGEAVTVLVNANKDQWGHSIYLMPQGKPGGKYNANASKR